MCRRGQSNDCMAELFRPQSVSNLAYRDLSKILKKIRNQVRQVGVSRQRLTPLSTEKEACTVSSVNGWGVAMFICSFISQDLLDIYTYIACL